MAGSGAHTPCCAASVLTLAAGFLFGPIYGTAIVSAAATLGATLAFLVSRYVARPLVLEKLGGNQRFLQISANVASKGPLARILPCTLNTHTHTHNIFCCCWVCKGYLQRI